MTIRGSFTEKLMTSQVSKLHGLKDLANSSLDIVRTITRDTDEMSMQDVDLVVKVLSEYRSTTREINRILDDFTVSLDDFKLSFNFTESEVRCLDNSSLSDSTDKDGLVP